jgi:hypothetical protein
MFSLYTDLMGKACRIFLEASYPEGPSTVPAGKLAYFHIRGDEAIRTFLPPAPLAKGICQKLGGEGWTFRLGSSRYPNLKLKVQCVGQDGAARCIFSVDTHDAFSAEHLQPPPDHPDAAAWLELQAANRILKEKIEAAWETAGLWTLNRLLRDELEAPADPQNPAATVPK